MLPHITCFRTIYITYIHAIANNNIPDFFHKSQEQNRGRIISDARSTYRIHPSHGEENHCHHISAELWQRESPELCFHHLQPQTSLVGTSDQCFAWIWWTVHQGRISNQSIGLGQLWGWCSLLQWHWIGRRKDWVWKCHQKLGSWLAWAMASLSSEGHLGWTQNPGHSPWHPARSSRCRRSNEANPSCLTTASCNKSVSNQ